MDIDLLITGDDLTLSEHGDAQTIDGRKVIAQDIKHMIREKGYAAMMVGNRNIIELAQLGQEIEIEMEEDVRLVPGTARVTQIKAGRFVAEADTVEYGPIRLRFG